MNQNEKEMIAAGSVASEMLSDAEDLAAQHIVELFSSLSTSCPEKALSLLKQISEQYSEEIANAHGKHLEEVIRQRSEVM